MSNDALHVEILFTSSKTLEPQLGEISLGKYKIRSIPTAKESLFDTRERLLLEFMDFWKNDQRSSNPQQESDYVLSLVSLISQAKVEFDSMKINDVQGTMKIRRSSFLSGKIELPSDSEDLLKKLYSFDVDVLRQFLRSCNAYRTALSLVDDSPTLSFFLLVTAVEAISNTVMKNGKRRNFTDFILKYIPKSFVDELGSTRLLRLLINQAYEMRSAFTHGGAKISIATISAADLNRNYVKHLVDDKEVYSPSLRWLTSLVRAVLLEFLRDQKIVEGRDSKLPDLAREEGIIHFKAAKDIEMGRVVTSKELDLDFKENCHFR